jgi:TPR repeat protein
MRRAIRLALLTWCCAQLPLVTGASAQSIETGIQMPLRSQALSGDAVSQFRYGEWLENDAATKPVNAARAEFKEAAKWYQLAADQDLAAAQNNLGAMYLDGRGVPEDAVMAQSYYRRAAQRGSVEGETNLSLLILKRRVPGSVEEGISWLDSAARQGFAPAEAQLAQIYQDGVLVSPDPSRALQLFQHSAEANYAWGEYGYALLLQAGTGTPRDPAGAALWMQRAADQDLPAALFDLSTMLATGSGLPSDKKRATMLLHRAAELGEPRAKARLADE